jgi:hypothetical protein
MDFSKRRNAVSHWLYRADSFIDDYGLTAREIRKKTRYLSKAQKLCGNVSSVYNQIGQQIQELKNTKPVKKSFMQKTIEAGFYGYATDAYFFTGMGVLCTLTFGAIAVLGQSPEMGFGAGIFGSFTMTGVVASEMERTGHDRSDTVQAVGCYLNDLEWPLR